MPYQLGEPSGFVDPDEPSDELDSLLIAHAPAGHARPPLGFTTMLREGLEPSPSGFGGRRSVQLSYRNDSALSTFSRCPGQDLNLHPIPEGLLRPSRLPFRHRGDSFQLSTQHAALSTSSARCTEQDSNPHPSA